MTRGPAEGTALEWELRTVAQQSFSFGKNSELHANPVAWVLALARGYTMVGKP